MKRRRRKAAEPPVEEVVEAPKDEAPAKQEAPAGPLCFNCAHVLLPGAKYCTGCHKHQRGWRRWIEDWDRVLKVLGALFGVLSALSGGYLVIRQFTGKSSTRVTIARADSNVLNVNVANTGARRSYLQDFELSFGALPIENRKLDVVVADSGVVNGGFAAASETRVGLLVRGLRTKARPGSSERYTRDEIAKLLDDRDDDVALLVTIRESDGKTRTDRIAFQSSLIRKLILNKLPMQEAEP